ncbi:DNA starvation/stationary phase protection protein Dps [Candidatus Babeliales bacterium]|nr:DNA starvation/stationary phase protection protein Dps [Candidatus Babeliales bacterium]
MKMHATRMSLAEKDRVASITMLNTTLASATDLMMQCKHAHWNVKGMTFIAMHKLFDEIAEQVEEMADVLAERITSLGGTALGTLKDVAENTQLRVCPNTIFTVKDHIGHLAHNMAILGEYVRDNIMASEKNGDMATSDIYIELVRMLDKNLWFLEAHLQA